MTTELLWIDSNYDEINVGDYVKGLTGTNSQKHGKEYNYAVEGTLTFKGDNLYDCKILDVSGGERHLCTFVGTSGWNDVYKLRERESEGK